MDHPASDKIKAFVSGFKGKALTAGDPDYDSSRAIWNGAIDRKPAVIARCADAGQVASAVRFARDSDLEIAVRGGGPQLCRDRGRRRRPDDPSRRDERGQRRSGGAPGQMRRRGHLGRSRRGDAEPWTGDSRAASSATPGVAGLDARRRHRLADEEGGAHLRQSPVAAEVVTADGRIVRASRDANPDLLWALKGGGGNFGIVTSFDFALHPVGPMVQLALLFAGLENGAAPSHCAGPRRRASRRRERISCDRL